MTKILYSPGFGAGWSTWMPGSSDFQKFVLTYQPIIEALEKGENLLPGGRRSYSKEGTENFHPALRSFIEEAKERFNERCYIGGARNLCVKEVSGPFRIDEYDGYGSVVESGDQDWIIL